MLLFKLELLVTPSCRYLIIQRYLMYFHVSIYYRRINDGRSRTERSHYYQVSTSAMTKSSLLHSLRYFSSLSLYFHLWLRILCPALL